MQSSELSKRVATGFVGGVLFLALLIYGGWIGIYALVLLLTLAMIHEFADITLSMRDAIEKRYVLYILTWCSYLGDLAGVSEYQLVVFSFLSLSTYYLLSADRHGEEGLAQHFKELMFSLFGLVNWVYLPLYLVRIHQYTNGVKWTILFFLIVWSVDTGAYFSGMKFGKRKLYPLISPKKTIEGGVGGLGVAILVALLYKVAVFRELSWLGVFFIPVLVGFVAQVGDLCESFLKRAFAKKDSGSILPGHGGFLDRFDGVVFSLPVMYACTRIFC